MPSPPSAAIYAFLAAHPHASSSHLARQFSLPLRTAAAYRATFTRRTGLGGIPNRHGGNDRPFRALPDAPLELAGTAWLRLAPAADPGAVPDALQAFLLVPRRVRVTARIALVPGPPKRRRAQPPSDQGARL